MRKQCITCLNFKPLSGFRLKPNHSCETDRFDKCKECEREINLAIIAEKKRPAINPQFQILSQPWVKL